jgi:hypothetical protein
MLLELLSAVGLGGGGAPSGGALAVLVLETERSMDTGPGGGGTRLLSEAEVGGPPRLWLAARGGPLVGGALPARDGSDGGPGLALTECGMPPPALGGGGVDFLVRSSGPEFLLTQRLSSGS